MANSTASALSTPRFTRTVRALGRLGFAGYLVASLLVWSAPWFWLGELAASFAWYLGLSGFVAAVPLLLLRCLRMSALTVALSFVHAGQELWLSLPDDRAGDAVVTAPTADTLKLANCNLLWTNSNHDGLRSWISEHDPDVVVCLETSPAWREVLEALEHYPHILLAPDEEMWTSRTWGTAILSKRPFASTRLIPVAGGASRPLMEARLPVGERTLTIRGAHPMRAGKAWRLALRDDALRTLADQEWGEYSVLLGDLNVTSTSPMFSYLTSRTGLRDSRAGFGRQPTYTTSNVIPGLSIAIDHVLVGDRMWVLDRETSVLPGSDHLSVIVRVAIDGE